MKFFVPFEVHNEKNHPRRNTIGMGAGIGAYIHGDYFCVQDP